MTANPRAADLRGLLDAALAEFAKRQAMRWRSRRWCRISGETTVGIWFQGSQYGPQFYCNLGIRLNELTDIRFLSYGEWQISVRLNNLAPEEHDRIRALFDAETPIDADERRREVIRLLERVAGPFVDQASTRAGIKTMLQGGRLKAADISPGVEDALVADQPGTID
jgi:hypothetical protein